MRYILALFFATTFSLYSQTEKKITIKLLKTLENEHQFVNPADSIYIRFFSVNGFLDKKGNRYQLKDKVPDADYVIFINNTLRNVFTMKDNKLNGSNISYHENGRLSTVFPHKNGKRHGLWQKFFEDGTLDFENLYSEEESISGTTYKNGKVEKKYYFKNGKLEKSETFNDLGELIETYIYNK